MGGIGLLFTMIPPSPTEPEEKIIDSWFIQRYIAKYFRACMEEAELTFREVAEKAGFSVPYLSGFFSGRENIVRFGKYRDIAHAIGISDATLDALLVEAKEAELSQSHGINNLKNVMASEDITDIRFALRNEGIADEGVIDDIVSYIAYRKSHPRVMP